MSTNETCFAPKAPQKGPSFFQHGNVVFQAHDVGWIVSGFFTIVATVTSFWLINKHLQWYTNKQEQRYIIRLLLMVPIYASISLASYLFWDNATPLLLIRDAYEAILLTAFFYLLLTYLSPDPVAQKVIFRKRGLSKEVDAERRRRALPRRKWIFPLGFVRWKPQDGLFFLQLMKWGVLQYCVVRPTTTLVAVILNHIGLYCEQSWSPAWGHIYISAIISISVTIAMYCLLQLYVCVSTELAPHRPLLKLISVKAVVFLTFWQATFLSLLSTFGIVKNTPYMTAGDINIGWGAILETFEMSIFAFVHIKAFSYKPYRPQTANAKRTPRLRSFAHAMDFRETFRELYFGLVYMWHRMRGVETDPLARRIAVLENAFDKSHAEIGRGHPGGAKEPVLEVDKAVEVAVDGERQWLGVGDDYGYGLPRRERSEALGVQFEKELQKKGYGRSGPDLGANLEHGCTHEGRRQSWWRSAYGCVSQGHSRHEEPGASASSSKRKSRSRPISRNAEQSVRVYDDHPPPSILRTYHDNRTASQELPPGALPPQFPRSAMFQDLPGSPVQDRYPVLPVNAAMSRADTVLDRLFSSNQPPRSDGGHTSLSGGISVVPSSQSHRPHLPFNATPVVLPQGVDAGRPVEVSMRHPGSPNTINAQGLHAEPTILPISPPPMQRSQERLDPSGAAEFPPSLPPKDIRRTWHRRELAHIRPSSAQGDFASASMIPVVPAPNIVSDPERMSTASNAEGRADMRDLRDRRTPPAVSHRPPKPRTYDAPLAAGGARSPRSRASVGVVVPTHTFSPEPPRSPRSKGTSRPVRGMSPPALRPPIALNYSLYHLPNALSPPSTPRADQTLSRHQDS